MEFNIEIKKATDAIYHKVSKTIPEIEWAIHAPYIYKINNFFCIYIVIFSAR